MEIDRAAVREPHGVVAAFEPARPEPVQTTIRKSGRELGELTNQRWRCDIARQEPQSLTFPRSPVPTSLGEMAFKRRPRGGLPTADRRLRPIRIVELQQRGL